MNDKEIEVEHLLEGFVVICNVCEKEGRPSDTTFHVDWPKKYYMIFCYTCGNTAAFNGKGQKITIKDKVEDKDKNKDEI